MTRRARLAAVACATVACAAVFALLPAGAARAQPSCELGPPPAAPRAAPRAPARQAAPGFETPFLGPGGEIRTLVRPEFRSAPGLLEDLRLFALTGLHVSLIGPLVPGPNPRGPPIPSRLLLRGSAEVVGQGREVLSYLDVPRPAVLVSLLAAEVTCDCVREMGGRVGFRRDGIPEAPKTVFRGLYSEFEPDSYLRSSLVGHALPFQGTSVALGNIGQTVLENGAFEVVLRYLAHEGNAEFLAWPALVCTEGEPGRIESLETREHRILAAVTSEPGGALSIRAEEVVSGLAFDILPVRVGTDVAVIDLEADIRYLLPESKDGLAAGEVVVYHRRVATRVTLRDSESLLIGGLRVRRRVEAKRGLPLLNGIPPLTARTKEFQETELLLLLRARILLPERGGGVFLPPGEARRLKKAREQPSSDCPDPWK